MAKEAEVKTEPLPDLDDLLQCPVCYEIPSGQIFQCNEGHHVCGRCKVRLDVCPVCRALFFGTRNYAMEELIASIRKLRAFKLGGKVTTGSSSADNNAPTEDRNTAEPESQTAANEEASVDTTSLVRRAPPACKGLFRCVCCKNGNAERLPAGRLLNHLRYFHSPDLIEGHSENGEYLQAWQFSTVPGRIVTAVRVSDMGIFFLVIEISNETVSSWLSMAAAPWVAHEFCYTVTISGNDREAIFSDCVWSVRSCEGSLKKRGHCLVVNGLDARALIAPVSINGKLSIRRTPPDQLAHQTQPRAVLRVANRGNARDESDDTFSRDLEPFLIDLQNDVARLSLAFHTLGREATALLRTEAIRVEDGLRASEALPPGPRPLLQNAVARQASRNARRRMRQRLAAAFNETLREHGLRPPVFNTNAQDAPSSQTQNSATRRVGGSPPPLVAVPSPRRASVQPPAAARRPSPPAVQHCRVGVITVQQPTVSNPPPSAHAQPTNMSLRNGHVQNNAAQNHRVGTAMPQASAPQASTARRANEQPPGTPQRQNRPAAADPVQIGNPVQIGLAIVDAQSVSSSSSSGNQSRVNKKKRRQRRQQT